MTADLFPARQRGTIRRVLEAGYGLGGTFKAYMVSHLDNMLGDYIVSFALVLGAIACSCASLGLAAPREARVVRL